MKSPLKGRGKKEKRDLNPEIKKLGQKMGMLWGCYYTFQELYYLLSRTTLRRLLPPEIEERSRGDSGSM